MRYHSCQAVEVHEAFRHFEDRIEVSKVDVNVVCAKISMPIDVLRAMLVDVLCVNTSLVRLSRIIRARCVLVSANTPSAVEVRRSPRTAGTSFESLLCALCREIAIEHSSARRAREGCSSGCALRVPLSNASLVEDMHAVRGGCAPTWTALLKADVAALRRRRDTRASALGVMHTARWHGRCRVELARDRHPRRKRAVPAAGDRPTA